MNIIIYSFIIIISILMDIVCKSKVITCSLITSFLLTTILVKYGISIFKKFKLNQIIRDDGPKEHLNKLGTPTMGGIFIIPIGILVGNMFSLNLANYDQLFNISLLTFGYMIIGSIDDFKSLFNKKSTGLNAKSKLILQIIIGFIFVKWGLSQNLITTDVALFHKVSFSIGYLIWPLSIFVLLAESNASNLTDGLDGLASGCASLVFTGLAFQLVLREGDESIAIANFCMAMAGSLLGFLIYNKNPAKIFMGDTGSLSIGAALGGIALITNSLWALLIMGGVFLAESLSVILQVSIFKTTKMITGKGKRFFLMAPIHHHFELKGMKEKNIVKNFWIITMVLICLGSVMRSTS